MIIRNKRKNRIFAEILSLAIIGVFLCAGLVYPESNLRLPLANSKDAQGEFSGQFRNAATGAKKPRTEDLILKELDEFDDFCRTVYGKENYAMVNILKSLLVYFGSYKDMKGLSMVELGPNTNRQLIEFLRRKKVKIKGIDSDVENDFVEKRDIIDFLHNEGRENFLDCIYSRNVLGTRFKIKDIKDADFGIVYNSVIRELFKDVYRVLTPGGIIITDSIDFIEPGVITAEFGYEDRLKPPDFERIGFEILVWGEQDVYILRKPKSSPHDLDSFKQKLTQI